MGGGGPLLLHIHAVCEGWGSQLQTLLTLPRLSVLGLLHCQSESTWKLEEQHLVFHLGRWEPINLNWILLFQVILSFCPTPTHSIPISPTLCSFFPYTHFSSPNPTFPFNPSHSLSHIYLPSISCFTPYQYPCLLFTSHMYLPITFKALLHHHVFFPLLPVWWILTWSIICPSTDAAWPTW